MDRLEHNDEHFKAEVIEKGAIMQIEQHACDGDNK